MIKHILHYVDVPSHDCFKNLCVPLAKVFYNTVRRGDQYGLRATFVCYDGYRLRGNAYYDCVAPAFLEGHHWVGASSPPSCISMLYAKIDLVLFNSQNQVKTLIRMEKSMNCRID